MNININYDSNTVLEKYSTNNKTNFKQIFHE